ncbi:MCE family protein [Rhodococcus sp. HNM0569]|uniref:MCE family protein n=1 Tax=Rhodococcus sp. HNM0569 TaxID=2716340 RepID=UPI00146D8AAB|nr:MCE family protein [Rhodococcus sp. HNM0569]
MARWVPKAAAAGFVCVLVAVLVLVYVSFRGGLATGTVVAVETHRAGLVLEPGSMVKAHGVQVGTVTGIRAGPDGVLIDLRLDPEEAQRLPSNVGAQIRATTVFGAKFVTLTDPPSPDPTPLHDGAVVYADRVTVETQTVFESLSNVLHAVDPAKLDETLGSLASGLRGRGDALGSALGDADTALSHLEPRLDAVHRDLVATEGAASVYTGAADDLAASLGNLTTTGATLTARADDLDRVLLAVTGMSETGSAVVEPNADAIVDVLDLLRPTASLLHEYAPVLPCFFQGADRARQLAEPASGGNGSTMMLNSTLLLGVDPYEYPRNLPVVEATGGPRCGALPTVTEGEMPAPYLVADTGANPFERGNTAPVLVPGSLVELLTGAPR